MHVLIFQVDHLEVFGDYEVEIRAHSFSNPSGRCEECRLPGDSGPRCCDATFFTPSCPATPTCDTKINSCFRPLKQTGPDCPPGQLVKPPVFLLDINNYTFGNDFFGFSNPEISTFGGAWMVIGSYVIVGCRKSLPYRFID